MTFPDLVQRLREVAAEYTPVEQRDLFHDTAARTYGIPGEQADAESAA